MEIAKGKWITFIDSDDYINGSYFTIFEDKDLIFASYQIIQSGKLVYRMTSEGLDNHSLSELVDKYGINSMLRAPWTKFYKRNLIADIRFPADMKVGEDTCFVWKYLSKMQNVWCSKEEYILFFEVIYVFKAEIWNEGRLCD